MKTIVSGGTWTKAPNTTTSGPFRLDQDTPWLDRFSDWQTVYRRQLWVYACVNKLAGAEARVPFKAFRGTGTDRCRLEAEHPLSTLLLDPHPLTPAFALHRWESGVRDMTGRAAFRLRRNGGGTVVRLEPIHPSRLTLNLAGDAWRISGTGSAGVQEVALSEVMVRNSMPTGTSLLAAGTPWIEPLRTILEVEHSSKLASLSFWQRGARPGFVLKHKGTLSVGAQQRLGQQFDALHGGAGNFGRTLVLEEDMEAFPLIHTNVDAQYIDTRKLNREEVCAGADVDPMVMHILDRATFGNVEEMLRGFYRDTMTTRFEEKQAVWNRMIAAEFQDSGDRIYVEADMGFVLHGDPVARAESMGKEVQVGLLTPNEGRGMLNRPTLGPIGDMPWVNSTMAPMSALTEARMPQTAVRSVLGRLGRVDDLAKVDLGALTKGLDPDDVEHVAYELAAASDIGDLRRRLRGAAS